VEFWVQKQIVKLKAPWGIDIEIEGAAGDVAVGVFDIEIEGTAGDIGIRVFEIEIEGAAG
jgi:hypothetical protein